jgi:CRISPR type I-E-associated protein CasB/Cse2
VVIAACKATEEAALQLGSLAANLARASGCSENTLLTGRQIEIRARLFAVLDQPFRRWISELIDAHETPQSALASWCALMAGHARSIAEEHLAQVPARAVCGHAVIDDHGKTVVVTAARAEAWFGSGLARAVAASQSPTADRTPGNRDAATERAAEPQSAEQELAEPKKAREPAWLAGLGELFQETTILSRQNGKDAGRLARWRRGLGQEPGQAPELWTDTTHITRMVGAERNAQEVEVVLHHCLTLYALHQQFRRDSTHVTDRLGAKRGSVGAACRELRDTYAAAGRPTGGVERGFRAVTGSGTIAEVAWQLRGLVQLMRTERVPLDYVMLAADLADWPHLDRRDRVLRRWGQDFLGVDAPALGSKGTG